MKLLDERLNSTSSDMVRNLYPREARLFEETQHTTCTRWLLRLGLGGNLGRLGALARLRCSIYGWIVMLTGCCSHC
jgi:hypothetical protein